VVYATFHHHRCIESPFRGERPPPNLKEFSNSENVVDWWRHATPRRRDKVERECTSRPIQYTHKLLDLYKLYPTNNIKIVSKFKRHNGDIGIPLAQILPFKSAMNKN